MLSRSEWMLSVCHLSIRGFFSMVAGRLKAAEVTTTEAVKKDLPPLCKATERFEKPLNFLTMKEHIIFLSKINYSLLANQSILKSEDFLIYEV